MTPAEALRRARATDSIEYAQFLLEAQREVDAMLPDTEPIAPSPPVDYVGAMIQQVEAEVALWAARQVQAGRSEILSSYGLRLAQRTIDVQATLGKENALK